MKPRIKLRRDPAVRSIRPASRRPASIGPAIAGPMWNEPRHTGLNRGMLIAAPVSAALWLAIVSPFLGWA